VRGNPKPQQACVRFEATETGYLMVAYGIVDGKAVAERPQAISTDGRRRPLLDLNGRPIPGVPPGAVAFGSRSDSQTLEIGAERRRKSAQRGDLQGISGWKDVDPPPMRALVPRVLIKSSGFFERVVPDPYVPQG
jgi:hypothetical protein